nr:phosphoadenylyl-sulfate reductase [Caldalkalibacillus salinus]
MNHKPLIYDQINQTDLDQMNEVLDNTDTLGVIEWAYDTYREELVYACSFGAEGIVLLHHIAQVQPKAKVVFLDTHLHFKETYELIDEVKQRFPELQIIMTEPELTIQQQAEQHGDQLWKKSPDLCCALRKIEPLKRALSPAKAWLSGLRREQSHTRAHTQFINLDHKFKSIKVCPLIHWTWSDVWTYIMRHKLPYNPLHDQGYPSIGCEPCTFAVREGQDSRAGRWSGQTKTECGLHQS